MITNILIAGFAGLVILVILTAIIKALVAIEMEAFERRLERVEWRIERNEQDLEEAQITYEAKKALALCEQPYISPETRAVAVTDDDASLKTALEYEQAKARQVVAEWLEGVTDSPNPDSSPTTKEKT
jgi:signal recognition particle receptor subunit beta